MSGKWHVQFINNYCGRKAKFVSQYCCFKDLCCILSQDAGGSRWTHSHVRPNIPEWLNISERHVHFFFFFTRFIFMLTLCASSAASPAACKASARLLKMHGSVFLYFSNLPPSPNFWCSQLKPKNTHLLTFHQTISGTVFFYDICLIQGGSDKSYFHCRK